MKPKYERNSDMKKIIREIFKSELGFAPDANEINIKSNTKIATVAEVNGHYYDYYKKNNHLSYRDRVLKNICSEVIETFVWNGELKKEIKYIIKYDEELQDFIKQYRFSDETFDKNFRSEFSFILDEKIEENKDLKKQLKEEAEKNINKNYDICVFARIKIKSKDFYGLSFADILKKNGIEFETNDLDLGIIYAWASSSQEKEYIYDNDGKTAYVYEFIVGNGDDYQSTIYSCDERLSKDFLFDFDYLNSQNKINWL